MIDRANRDRRDDRERRDDPASAELEGFGLRARFMGDKFITRELYMTALIIACTALLMWDKNTGNAVFLEQHKTTQKLLAGVIASQADVIKELRSVASEVKSGNNIQAYVMSLSQGQRERLNLSMPDDLRTRIRSGSQ